MSNGSSFSYFFDGTSMDAPYIDATLNLNDKNSEFRLLEVPNKYIKSFEVQVFKDEKDNKIAARYNNLKTCVSKWTLDLSVPINTFDFNGDNFTAKLLTAAAKSYTSESNESGYSNIDITYGWNAGTKVHISNGYITDITFEQQKGGLNFKLVGVCDSVSDCAYETATTIEISENKTKSTILNLADSLPENKKSYVIEYLAKYIFGKYYKTIEVDHTDKLYDGTSTDYLNTLLSNVDAKNCTLFGYLVKLIETCKVYVEEVLEKSDGTLISNFITLNGQNYAIEKITTDINTSIGIMPGAQWQSCYGNIDNCSNINTKFESYIASGRESYTFKDESGEYYKASLIRDSSVLKSGTEGTSFRMFRDPIHSIIKIGPISEEDSIAEFIYSNNSPYGEVLDFSISASGIPAVSGIYSIIGDNTSSIDITSGLSITSFTSAGGSINLESNKLDDTAKEIISKIGNNISNETSEGSIRVYGSQKNVEIGIPNKIRIIPTLNNGNTAFIGDYTVMGITHRVNSEGFTIEFNIKFSKSNWNTDYQKIVGEFEKIKNVEKIVTTNGYVSTAPLRE